MDSKLIAIVALAIAATGTMMALQPSNTSASVEAFQAFKLKYNRAYASSYEEAYRFSVYVQNIKDNEEFNAKGTETYTKGENLFTDMTLEEWKGIYARPLPSKQEKPTETFYSESFIGDINWVTKGVTPPVLNQGQCGSCWTFSTVESVESLCAIRTGTVGSFSEQQLVDCDRADGNQGCSGGWPYNAIDYLASAGICTKASYPYTAQDGTCKASSCTKSSFTISGHTKIAVGSESSLKAACDKQPVSITINAEPWFSYSGGILTNCPAGADHAVLLAGYTSAYWLVQNSWGASWGESGFIRLGPGNECGIENNAVVPK